MHRGRRRTLRGQIIARDGAVCMWCSCALGIDHEQATLDHVRQGSQGGSWSVTNLVLACRSCNQARGDKDVLVWAAMCRDAGKVVHVQALVAAITRADEPLADAAYFKIAQAEHMAELRAAALARRSRKQRAHAAQIAEHRFRREMRDRRRALEQAHRQQREAAGRAVGAARRAARASR